MSTGAKGQQIIDTIRDFHHLALEGFGTFYVVALILSAVWCLFWLNGQRQEWKVKSARRKAQTARRRRAARRAHAETA
jgi:predicted exporter